MRTHISLASALALALGAQIASAQFTPPTFDGLNTDKNDSLSKEEFDARPRPQGGPPPGN